MYHLAKGLYMLATSKEEYSVILLGLDNAGKTTFHEQVKALFHPDAPEPKLKTVPTVGQNVSTITLPDMYMKIWDVGGQHSLRKLWQSYYTSCHAIVFIIDSTDIGDGILEPRADDDNDNDDAGEGAGGGDAAAAPADGSDGEPAPPPTGRRRASSAVIPGGKASGAATAADVAAAAAAAGRGGAADVPGRLEECRLVLEDVLQSEDTDGVPLLILANKQDREDCVEVVRIKEGLVKRVFEGEKSHSIRDSRVLPVSALTGTGVREAVEWLRSRVKWNKESRPPVMR
ncbi:hypothetical protein RB595_000674 [Gaeumannomyces hyphopodioides]